MRSNGCYIIWELEGNVTDPTNWNKDLSARYNKALERAWTDADYKAKLLGQPRDALAEVGIELPAGMSVNIVECDDENLHLVLPQVPEGEICDQSLQGAVGGNICVLCFCSCSSGSGPIGGPVTPP